VSGGQIRRLRLAVTMVAANRANFVESLKAMIPRFGRRRHAGDDCIELAGGRRLDHTAEGLDM